MGTWDVGPFDNDDAADWCGSLDDAPAGSRHALIREALAEAADTTGYLDSAIGVRAVAAAALVAAGLPGGEPPCPHYGPKQPLPALGDLRAAARTALDRVISEPSELLELWEDPKGPWAESVQRLRQVLAIEPPGA